MNRITAHILQKTSYLAAFIVLSSICARSVTVYSDVRPRDHPLEWMIPLVTLLLAFQFGAFLRGEITIRRMRWRWLIGALFFGALSFVASPSLLNRVNWDVIGHAFNWPISWDYVLEGVGEFCPHVVLYWMPLAGLLSLTAFIASFTPRDADGELAGQDVSPNA